jgi:hypothetical protein
VPAAGDAVSVAVAAPAGTLETPPGAAVGEVAAFEEPPPVTLSTPQITPKATTMARMTAAGTNQ